MIRQIKRHFKSHIGFVCLILVFSFSAHAQAVHGVLKVVKGDVQIIQASDGKKVAAKIGQKVFPKDTIIAGKESRAKIVMVDNNEINISPDSKIEIQSYDYKPEEDKKSVILNVMYGKVRSKVNQKYEGENKFQVKTPSAVAGVRGTDFMTGYDPSTKASSVVTFQGNVAVGQPGPNGQIQNPVYVGAGQMTSASGNKPPNAPTSVPKDQLAKMDTESNADKGGGQKGGDTRQPADDGKKDKGDKDKDKGDKDKGGDKAADKGSDKGDKGTDKNSKADSGSKGSGAPVAAVAAAAPDAGSAGASTSSNSANSPSSTAAPTSAAAPGNAPVADTASAPATAAAPTAASNNPPPPTTSSGPMPASVGAPILAPPPSAMPNIPTSMPGSTLTAVDMPSATTPVMPTLPPTVAPPPPPPTALPPATNTFVNNVISNQNRKVTIVITGGP